MEVTGLGLVTRSGPRADRFDALLAAVLCAAGIAEGLLGGIGGDRRVYVAAAVLSTLPLAGRRRWPGPSAVIACVPMMASPYLPSPIDDLFVFLLVLVVALGSVALHGDTRTFATAHAIVVAGLAIPVLLVGEGLDDAIYIVAFTSLIAAPARLLRHRLLQVGRLSERALRAELAVEAQARAAVAEERTRLARELHDIIGHGVSLMVVQASAAESNLDDEVVARQSLEAVQQTGREAIADLSRLLALLRDDGAVGDLAPQPGMADLDRLVVEPSPESGRASHVTVAGDPGRVSAALGLTVYRVVQEGLTNVRRHAVGAPVSASVRIGEHQIDIEVANGPGSPPTGRPPTAGTGTGLAGLRERVSLFGGAIDAGPGPDGGFALRARLPLNEPTR